ncbi:MAG: hypothetical protein COT55_01350 [Candidatus Diapherotrites archaeon CG09_land_8_20_14_0_10_32_12]|nr:MAG: hypothetical protein COT55_01350 [Candidatus Diapherotrites archaeon CG09_land_8_20_14_0_10_32_12]
MDKTFIFDYDDTLAWNQHDYSYAQIEFLNWIIFEKLWPNAPDLQSIINLEVEIDNKNVETMSFSMERFPTSFQQTYKSICEEKNINYNKEDLKEDLKKAYEIGMLAFDEKRWKKLGLVDGAKETLDFLVEKEDELILLTKGDLKIQEKKIKATDCQKWFGKEIYIVPQKDAGVIDKIVGNRNPSKVWHVGNSARSDVQHALKAGIKMIYIPCETWAYERKHEKVEENPRLITFQKIIEIKNNYNSLI